MDNYELAKQDFDNFEERMYQLSLKENQTYKEIFHYPFNNGINEINLLIEASVVSGSKELDDIEILDIKYKDMRVKDLIHIDEHYFIKEYLRVKYL